MHKIVIESIGGGKNLHEIWREVKEVIKTKAFIFLTKPSLCSLKNSLSRYWIKTRKFFVFKNCFYVILTRSWDLQYLFFLFAVSSTKDIFREIATQIISTESPGWDGYWYSKCRVICFNHSHIPVHLSWVIPSRRFSTYHSLQSPKRIRIWRNISSTINNKRENKKKLEKKTHSLVTPSG